MPKREKMGLVQVGHREFWGWEERGQKRMVKSISPEGSQRTEP